MYEYLFKINPYGKVIQIDDKDCCYKMVAWNLRNGIYHYNGSLYHIASFEEVKVVKEGFYGFFRKTYTETTYIVQYIRLGEEEESSPRDICHLEIGRELKMIASLVEFDIERSQLDLTE